MISVTSYFIGQHEHDVVMIVKANTGIVGLKNSNIDVLFFEVPFGLSQIQGRMIRSGMPCYRQHHVE